MCNENSRFNRARVISCPQRKEAQKEMMKKIAEIREEILKANPMTSLYWDANLDNWVIIVAKSQKLDLPNYGYEVDKQGNLPKAEDFPRLPGLRELVLNGNLIAYVISGKNL